MSYFKDTLQVIKKDSLDRFVFVPTWDNAPPHRPPLLTLNGSRIGSEGNLVTLIAPPAAGKSSICEAIASSILNSECDSFGLQAHIEADEELVYIDTERSKSDHYTSWLRCMKRAGINRKNKKLAERITFFNIRGLGRVSDNSPSNFTDGISRWTFLVRYAFANPRAKIIILDGIADFVSDVNSSQECANFLYTLSAYANELNRCIIATIHDTASNLEKPRGHLGSELVRRSECVLIARRDAKTSQHTITTDFQFGKVRNDSRGQESHFTWDIKQEMFISCENQMQKPKSQDDLRNLAQKIFEEKISFSYTELLEKIAALTQTSKQNGKRRFSKLKESNLILKDDLSGTWLLNQNEF
jgi:hypothetical protein